MKQRVVILLHLSQVLARIATHVNRVGVVQLGAGSRGRPVRIDRPNRIPIALRIQIRPAVVSLRVPAKPPGVARRIPALAAADQAVHLRVGVVAYATAVAERVGVGAGRGEQRTVGRVDVCVGYGAGGVC